MDFSFADAQITSGSGSGGGRGGDVGSHNSITNNKNVVNNINVYYIGNGGSTLTAPPVQQPVNLKPCDSDTSQQWMFWNKHGAISIQSAKTGDFLGVEGDLANGGKIVTQINPFWWKFGQDSNGSIRFTPADKPGFSMGIEATQGLNGIVSLQPTRPNDPSQTWTVSNEPISGNMFSTKQVHSPASPQAKNSMTFRASSLPVSYPIGIIALEVDKKTNLRVKTYTTDVDKTSFTAHIDAEGDTILYSAKCTWLEVCSKNYDIQHGSFSTTEIRPNNRSQPKTSSRVKFPKRFSTMPKVVVWLSSFDMDKSRGWRIKTYATDITVDGFNVYIDTWGDTILYSGACTWIAYPSDRPNITSGSYNTMDVRPWNKPQAKNEGECTFDRIFHHPPQVFSALNTFDYWNGADLRLEGTITDVDERGISWSLNSWSDSTMYSAGASYIAIQDF